MTTAEPEDIRAERRARWARIEAERRAREARDDVLLQTFLADPRPRLFLDRSTDRPVGILVSPDMETPGQWRISRWDAIGPIGHNVRPTLETALRRALEDDADFSSAVATSAGDVETALGALGIVIALDARDLGRVLTRDDRDPSVDVTTYLDRLLATV